MCARVCVRACTFLGAQVFVNRKYKDARSQRTQSHWISHSDKTAQLTEASPGRVVMCVVCVFPLFMGGPICSLCKLWTAAKQNKELNCNNQVCASDLNMSQYI